MRHCPFSVTLNFYPQCSIFCKGGPFTLNTPFLWQAGWLGHGHKHPCTQWYRAGAHEFAWGPAAQKGKETVKKAHAMGSLAA